MAVQETFEQTPITELDDDHKFIAGKGLGTSFFNITWLALKSLLAPTKQQIDDLGVDAATIDDIKSGDIMHYRETLVDGTDLNDVYKLGIYVGFFNRTYPNNPYAAKSFYLTVKSIHNAQSTSDIIQQVEVYDGLGNTVNISVRKSYDNAFTNWVEVYHSGNLTESVIKNLGFLPYNDTSSVTSFSVSKGFLKVGQNFNPTSSADPAGENGNIVFGGDYLYYKSHNGNWLRLKGDIF